MFALLAALIVTSAVPDATLQAINCKARKCKVTQEKSVWKVTLPKPKDSPCAEAPVEWWFVSPEGKGQLLLTVCNDGYGASGVGDDTITVDDKTNTFTHSRYGGSAWRWTSETKVGLVPLRVISESNETFHATAPNVVSSSSWNWDAFSGKWAADVAPCSGEGEPNPEGEAQKVEATLIPSVKLPAPFVAGGWKTTGLAGCSAPGSFVTFGKQTGSNDASLRVVASGPELFVAVRDDVFVERAAKWTLADHVELWLADEPDPWMTCASQRGGEQWGLALDGTTNAGHGSPKSAPKVEVARGEGVVRLRVTFAEAPKRVTVVYSDTDDGKKQKSLVATSKLKFATVATFGQLKTLPESQAECVVEGEALVPRVVRAYQPEKAVIE